MSLRQMMFHTQYTSLGEEVFTTRMKNLILTSNPAGTFGTMEALLAPYVVSWIHEVMSTMARLGNIEVKSKELSTKCVLYHPLHSQTR